MNKYIFKTLIVVKLEDLDTKFILAPKYNLKGEIKYYIEPISGDKITEEIKDRESIFNYFDMGMVDGLKYADINLIISMYNDINKVKDKTK